MKGFVAKAIRISTATLIGVVSSLVAMLFAENPWILVFVAFLGPICLYLLLRLMKKYRIYLGKPFSMCATAVVVRDDQVLLVHNPRHKKWLFPGTHFSPPSQPQKIILKTIKRETGYEAVFDNWHNPTKTWDRWATQIEEPWLVLLENQFAGEGHDIHYDFFYLCRLREGGDTDGGELSHRWQKVEDLASIDTYPDVIILAKLAVKAVGRKRKH